MTTEPPTAPARDAGVENLFETVFKGYAKRQVEDYIAWLQEQVSAAKAELTDARRELAGAREDLVSTREQLQTRPQHEEVSVRMSQILRLAEEEAQQERDQAAQQAGSVLEQARGEARSALEAAQESAAEIVRTARRECDDELAAARAEANRLVETARRQAEATLSDSRDRAQRALADADRRTEQITALQQRRLAAVLAAHEDAVNRLETVRGVIGEVLVQDREQGDPGADVDASPLPAAGTPLDPATLQPAQGSGDAGRVPGAASMPPAAVPDPGGSAPVEHGQNDQVVAEQVPVEPFPFPVPQTTPAEGHSSQAPATPQLGTPAVASAPIPFPASAQHAVAPSPDGTGDFAEELDDAADDVGEGDAEGDDLDAEAGLAAVDAEGNGSGRGAARRAAARTTRVRKTDVSGEDAGTEHGRPSPGGQREVTADAAMVTRAPRDLMPGSRPEHDGILGGLDS
ncbi:MAG: hypothetical protein ACXV0U_05045 [Kineosporiaceae bacterium]